MWKWSTHVEWKMQDLWVGLFWKRTRQNFDLWLCFVPCLPLHISRSYVCEDCGEKEVTLRPGDPYPYCTICLIERLPKVTESATR